MGRPMQANSSNQVDTMFKRFDDYSEALNYGRKINSALGCYVHCVTVYVEVCGPMPEYNGKESYRQSRSVAFVATPSSYHKLHGLRGASMSCGSWYFGGTGRMSSDPSAAAILAEADEDALPGRQEYWYGMFAGHTSGFTHAEILEMCAEVERNNSCVWHECAMLARRKNPSREIACHCGRCR